MRRVTYQCRQGVHGEFVIDKCAYVVERLESVGRAATEEDAATLVRQLNSLAEIIDWSKE